MVLAQLKALKEKYSEALTSSQHNEEAYRELRILYDALEVKTNTISEEGEDGTLGLGTVIRATKIC